MPDENYNPILVISSLIIDEPDEAERSRIEKIVFSRLLKVLEEAFADLPAVSVQKGVEYISLSDPTGNAGHCARCGCWMTDWTKPHSLATRSSDWVRLQWATAVRSVRNMVERTDVIAPPFASAWMRTGALRPILPPRPNRLSSKARETPPLHPPLRPVAAAVRGIHRHGNPKLLAIR